MASLPFFIFGVLQSKTPGGLSQPPSLAARLWRQMASLPFFIFGVLRSKTPGGLPQPPSLAARPSLGVWGTAPNSENQQPAGLRVRRPCRFGAPEFRGAKPPRGRSLQGSGLPPYRYGAALPPVTGSGSAVPYAMPEHGLGVSFGSVGFWAALPPAKGAALRALPYAMRGYRSNQGESKGPPVCLDRNRAAGAACEFGLMPERGVDLSCGSASRRCPGIPQDRTFLYTSGQSCGRRGPRGGGCPHPGVSGGSPGKGPCGGARGGWAVSGPGGETRSFVPDPAPRQRARDRSGNTADLARGARLRNWSG
jgi:hypothetical protein